MRQFGKLTALLGFLILALNGCAGQVETQSQSSAETDLGAPTRLPSLATDHYLTRIAFGSCADEALPQPIWSAIAAQNPDLFLFIGDNVYADLYKGKFIKEPTLEALQYAYQLLGAREDFGKFRRQFPIMATWDDHDYGANDAGENFPLKQEAKDLMLNFFGVPEESPVRQREGVYDAKIVGPVGQRVQIIMLDTRWFRSDLTPTDEYNAPGKERYLTDTTPGKTMLGGMQWKWLEEQLRQPAELRLLVSSIQVIADNHGWEAWRTLSAERDRLYQLIRDTGAEHVVMLSGDRHVGGFYKHPDAAGYPIYELTSSSLNKAFATSGTVGEFGPYQMGHLFGPENFGMISVNWPDQILSMELKNESGSTVRAITISMEDLRNQPSKDMPK